MKRSIIAAALVVPGMALAQAAADEAKPGMTMQSAQLQEGSQPEASDGNVTTDPRDVDGGATDGQAYTTGREGDGALDEGSEAEARDGNVRTDARDADTGAGDDAVIRTDRDDPSLDEGSEAEARDGDVKTDPRDADG